ncbi:MAG TPA: hypothetical protein VGD98_13210 [Ktedonobacteraceae bacterium]
MKFEKWAEEVRPRLADPDYLKTASYDELRLAVRIIGIKVTVFPGSINWERHFDVDVTVPEVMKKLFSNSVLPRRMTPSMSVR